MFNVENNQTASQKMSSSAKHITSIVGLVPLIFFIIIITVEYFFRPFGNSIFNPPNLLPALNILFVTGIGIIIAVISVQAYLKTGSLNILLLGSAVLLGGLASLVGGLTANISANYGVTTHNTGMLASSILQLTSVISTYRLINTSQSFKKRLLLIIIAYCLIISFMIVLTILTLVGSTPIFFTSNGPTLIRQIVLGSSILLFTISAFGFLHHYFRSHFKTLYWYSLGLGFFAVGMLGVAFQLRNADASTWIGRIAQYIGGFYFIIALLSLRGNKTEESGFIDLWAQSFTFNREQIVDLFSNLIEAFALCKIINDDNDKPIDFVVLQVNDSWEKIAGIRKESVLDKRITQIIPDINNDSVDWINKFGKVAISMEPERFEEYFKPFDKWLSISVYSPKKGYFVILFHDISKRKKIEETLKQRTEQLEQTQKRLEANVIIVEEYANQMEQLAQQRLNQLKDAERLSTVGQVAAMVGHDIRNPLQAIIGDIYLAESDLALLPTSVEKTNAVESLKEIRENIDYISKIVADLQDYSRILKPVAKETNLEDLFRRALLNVKPPENIKVSLKIDDEVKSFVTDPDLLKRILSNLISNGIQAMPNGGKLVIYASKKTNNIIVTVKDTGAGIPDDVKSKLFTPLFTTKSRGQGFGLAVVKRLTEALGGTVTFKSEIGKGTKFIITLPA